MAKLDATLRPRLSRRLAAFLVDAALLVLFISLSQWAFHSFLGERLSSRLTEGFDQYRWDLLTISIPVWSYFVVSESLMASTPGKRLMGLRVRPVEEETLNANHAFRRTAAKLLPFELMHVGVLIPSPLWLTDAPGFRWPLLAGNILLAYYAVALLRSPARQAPHDRAAGTVVVNARV